ncbi:hypothetical protein CC80DRAFT_92671 [Byssothecium circinans]|uniref:Uncharacterized protein n=1 Tax=Byssothecium circinans TaxID=147558 RepID=A0A6A5TRU0_9PLEO|nr:hypothetical protein CC80DRAFT_92671 [Byssothecium circinans]
MAQVLRIDLLFRCCSKCSFHKHLGPCLGRGAEAGAFYSTRPNFNLHVCYVTSLQPSCSTHLSRLISRDAPIVTHVETSLCSSSGSARLPAKQNTTELMPPSRPGSFHPTWVRSRPYPPNSASPCKDMPFTTSLDPPTSESDASAH